jgi:pyrroline-5-carboxylate reductase
MEPSFKIGFLGAGKMATALAQGFLRAGLVAPSGIIAGDTQGAAREAFAGQTKARATESNAEVVAAGDIIVLAVKPDQAAAVLSEIGLLLQARHLVVSIVAGLSLSSIEAKLPPTAKVIRVMPNTPALAGESASAFAPGKLATKEDTQTALKLLSSVGYACQVKESLLDAVTGLSGSGPAYVCVMIEALADGGVAAGLPRDLAIKLAAQTLLGTAKMVLETGLHPGHLKDMVASPGGTTIEGLHELEKAGVRGALMNAVRAAAAKSKILGQN